jgi:HTH-type transcriptional regulator / antitoxin HigA
MIRYTMKLKGWSQKNFADLLGSAPRASEILNRKRPLTIRQAYLIHKEWGVPAEALLAPYHIEDAQEGRAAGVPATPVS